MLASTASPHPIVGSDELALVMAQRRGRPLLLIDIAVPRDIDPACRDLEGVSLYDMDDLQAVARGTSTSARRRCRRRWRSSSRRSAASRAGWPSATRCPTVAALHERAGAIVDQVLAENARRWESASPRDVARVEAIARAVVSRLLHEPTIRLRTLGPERGHASLEVLRELFGLEGQAGRGGAAGACACSPRCTTAAPPPRGPAPHAGEG